MSYAQAYCRVVQPGLGVLVAWSSETFKGLASGPDAENFSAADWTSALSSGAAILHGNGLGVLDIPLLLALDAISFHSLLTPFDASYIYSYTSKTLFSQRGAVTIFEQFSVAGDITQPVLLHSEGFKYKCILQRHFFQLLEPARSAAVTGVHMNFQ
jgi:hypothetical protein